MLVEGDKHMRDGKRVDLFDEAADWFMRLENNDQDALLLADFALWLDTSSDHRLAWEKTCRAWNALGSFEVTEPVRDHPAISPSAMPRRRSGVVRRSFSRAAKGVAVLTALCLGILIWPDASLRLRADYVTANMETRTIALQDGTQVKLAPESAIAIDYQPGRRGVTLLAGEAYFDVKKDEDQPFTVQARDMKVEVLGTAFDIQMSEQKTSVALERGSVRATVGDGTSTPTQLLAPGERVVLDEVSGVIQRQNIDVAEIAAWRKGQLYVVDETVGNVIDMIRPYHPAWISIPDPTLADSRVTGFYNLANPDEALEALVSPYGGKIRAVANTARIVSRF